MKVVSSRFGIPPVLGILLILFAGCGIKLPVEKGEFKESNLVELIRLDSTIKLDIRYATSNNLVGRPVYTEARAFLQNDAALALKSVNQTLRPLGFGVLVFDGYRPWSVTKLFWDITSKENKQFVADPRKGSKHNRGCAVDLSLFDLNTGKEIEMTGAYDEMTERSYPDYKGGTEKQRAMRDLLRKHMEAAGFQIYEFEWWHYDYKDWQKYRIGNIPFDQIR